MAASLYSSKLSKGKYRNWVKAALAVLITKEGITPFVCDEIEQFQKKCLRDICNNNGLPAGTTCSGCCTENVVVCPTYRICNVGRGKCRFHRDYATRYIPSGCPGKICHNFKNEIQKAHRYSGPSYRNTDATQWCSNPWEVAKCFMPPDGYKDFVSVAESDSLGIISIIINLKDFQSKVHDDLSKTNNIFYQARDVFKVVRHSPNLEVEDTDLQHYFTVLQNLLSEPGYLASNTDAQNAKQKLSQLLNDTLVIGKNDVRMVLDDVAKTVKDKIKNEKDEFKKEAEKQTIQQLKEIEERVVLSVSELGMLVRSSVDELEKQQTKLVRQLQAETNKVKAAEGDTDAGAKGVTSKSEEDVHKIGEILTTDYEEIYNRRKDSNLPEEILKMDRESVLLYKKALKEGKISVHNIRVMVVGHYDVGKTTLTKRLLGEPVDITKRQSTNGIDVHIDRCKISVKDGTWILQKSNKTRKALFHQLANLFRKKNQQEETELKHSEKGNTVSDSGDMTDALGSDTPSQPKGSDTPSQPNESDIPTQPREKDTPSQSREDDHEHILKHLKKFIENVETEDEHFGTSDLSLWDFAGQNVFYATHQVFFSRRAVYLLVTNMSKHITDMVDDDPWHTDCKGEKCCKVAEYLDFWLNSIHEFCSVPGNSGPPVVLVGTFADKLTKEISTEDACSTLREFLIEKAASCHLTTENFLLDNSVVDENIDALRKHIIDVASEQDYWGEDIPAKWVTLEDILAGIKEENLKVLSKGRLRELNMTLPSPIETDDELELYLHFHHDMGNIIYFSEGDLANYILLDPQWLIDAFKGVITAKSFCICRTNIQKEWMDFERTAVLKQGLIDTIWQNSDYYKYRNLLLMYMEKLGLVARPVREENHSVKVRKVEDWYFVPCMLKESPPKSVTKVSDSECCKCTSKLCYTTDEEPDKRFFPTTVFNKMLAACLQRWPLFKENKKSVIFCGGAVFCLRENHFLYIFFYEHVLQIWIKRLSLLDGQFPDPSVCTETKDILEYMIKSNLKMHSKIIPFVKCPSASLYSNENMFLLETSEDFSGPAKVCFCQENEHLIPFHELTKYWSNDEDLEDSSGIEKDANSRFTEMDFCKIVPKIGKEYVQLGFKLGFSRAELDHIELDERTTANKIMAILGKWDQTMGVEATYCRLKRALMAIGKTAAEAAAVLR